MSIILLLLALAALITSLLSAAGKCPGYVPVLLLACFAVVQVLPAFVR